MSAQPSARQSGLYRVNATVFTDAVSSSFSSAWMSKASCLNFLPGASATGFLLPNSPVFSVSGEGRSAGQCVVRVGAGGKGFP